MRRHDLKCWKGPFEAVRLGLKTYEIRKDDRGFQEGDILFLREWDDELTGTYTGRAVEMRVTYMTRGPEWGIPEGMVVMAIDRASDLIQDSYPPEMEDPEVIRDLLLLVEQDVPIGKIEAWTPEERNCAADWAAALHLVASDNGDVSVPMMPTCVSRDAIGKTAP